MPTWKYKIPFEQKRIPTSGSKGCDGRRHARTVKIWIVSHCSHSVEQRLTGKRSTSAFTGTFATGAFRSLDHSNYAQMIADVCWKVIHS